MPANPPVFNATELVPGRVYRVILSFTDYDQISHPPGETWRYLGKGFLPYEDGLSLFIEQDGRRITIRLQWLPESQSQVIEHFSDYVEAL